MTQSPASQPRTLRPFGRVHIVGIGGIGMSGIAEVMHVMGYEVQGSDLSENANTNRLAEMGVPILIGHHEENITGAGVVTVSSAVADDNVEMQAARARHIPVVRRAEMLAELMRLKPCLTVAGTHGKTTTTSLAAAVLDAAGLDPTVINGGIINAYGTNARLGSGDWMVVEADESDGTFVRLPSTMGIVTNIDPEHLEHYGSFENLRDAFVRYMQNIPFYGAGIACLDHPEVQALVGKVQDRRIISYGLNEQADIQATNIATRGFAQEFDIICRDRRTGTQSVIPDMHLPMAGIYNLQNALAAIAAGLEARAKPEQIRVALSGFSGVKRRFSHVGKVRDVDIFDDYAHHPVEIAAVLGSAREAAGGRVIGVMQPHRYTRLRDLFADFCNCMNAADVVFVLPVFTAGEEPIEGFDTDQLVKGLRAHGHRHAEAVAEDDALAPALAEIIGAGDVVVCMGAGSITHIAHELPARLAEVAA